jgi:hypothetical protein
MLTDRQNSENDNIRFRGTFDEKTKAEQHNPKGMINDHPRSLKSESSLFILMVYAAVKKEKHIIAVNSILSYTYWYIRYYPFILNATVTYIIP